ncbi:hypothetical protein AU196_01885 [Mycobacterium sp. IS-1742]|nr:hypothetical protein AU196_01885 [Mycobacterium sp. IS-1742]
MRCGRPCADIGVLGEPTDRRTEPAQLLPADQLAPVTLGQFARSRGEFVVGDDHGARAVLHRRTGDHLLDRTGADGTRLAFALDGHPVGTPAEDEVDAPVAGQRGHDHRHPARAGDVCDVVLELGARHLVLDRRRRGGSREGAEEETGPGGDEDRHRHGGHRDEQDGPTEQRGDQT